MPCCAYCKSRPEFRVLDDFPNPQGTLTCLKKVCRDHIGVGVTDTMKELSSGSVIVREMVS